MITISIGIVEYDIDSGLKPEVKREVLTYVPTDFFNFGKHTSLSTYVHNSNNSYLYLGTGIAKSFVMKLEDIIDLEGRKECFNCSMGQMIFAPIFIGMDLAIGKDETVYANHTN